MNQDNMELTALQFLIVCPLVFLAGLVDAMAGGGGLISLPAYLISGLPVHYAIAGIFFLVVYAVVIRKIQRAFPEDGTPHLQNSNEK